MNKVLLYTPVWTILTHVTLNRKANCRRTHAASFHLYEVQNQAEPNNTVVYFCNIGKKYTDYKLKFRIIVTSLEEKWCWEENSEGYMAVYLYYSSNFTSLTYTLLTGRNIL